MLAFSHKMKVFHLDWMN